MWAWSMSMSMNKVIDVYVLSVRGVHCDNTGSLLQCIVVVT